MDSMVHDLDANLERIIFCRLLPGLEPTVGRDSRFNLGVHADVFKQWAWLKQAQGFPPVHRCHRIPL
jgi:hypothetical protein